MSKKTFFVCVVLADTGGKFLGGIDGFIGGSLYTCAEGRKRIMGDLAASCIVQHSRVLELLRNQRHLELLALLGSNCYSVLGSCVSIRLWLGSPCSASSAPHAS